jgi:fatty-acyl-CoA synthase
VLNPAAAGPTVGELTLRVLRRAPDQIAFRWDGGHLTCAQTVDLIGRYQAVFAAAGLGRGNRVGLLSANRAEAWCAGIAAQASGMATSWLHPLNSAADQRRQLQDAEIDALVVDERHHAARGAALADAVGRLWSLGPSPDTRDLTTAAAEVGSSTARNLAQAQDVAAIAFTGGTTGGPKGVVRRHPAAVALSATGTLTDFEIPPRARYLAVAPISHVGGTKVLPVLIRGGTVHLAQGFAPEEVLATIERERISMTLLVPTMIYALLDHPSLEHTDTSSLELLLYGAAPMARTRLTDGLARLGPVFSQLYGQTECYPISVLRRADHAEEELLSSCGTPVSNCSVRLLDDDGQDVPAGEVGEITVRSPAAMDEYWKVPDVRVDGWLRTGDLARSDERGFLHLADRKKDMIISGGFNVYPREVEDALAAHPDVAAAAVFGVPDERWGEAVAAAVVLRAGSVTGTAELLAHVRALKGPVQTPKRLRFVSALPVTPLGKVDKRALRADGG